MDAKYLKILDKIRKLLALAQSPNENEAALALAMAKDLMLRYNIDNIDLEQETTEDIIEIDFKISHQAEESSLRFVYWLGKAFLVRPILIKRNIGQDKIKFERYIRFIGKQADVAASTYIFSFIMLILDKKEKEYSKKSKIKKDYSLGFITAVCDKLKQIEDEKQSKSTYTVAAAKKESMLILSTNALIDNYIKEKYNEKLFEGNNINMEIDLNHFRNGYIEGGKYNLNKGLENHKSKIVTLIDD